MRSVLSLSGFTTGIKLSCLLVLVLGATVSSAQEIGSLTGIDEEAEVETGRERHPFVLAFSGSAVHLIPINILKEEIYDINDLTTASFGYSAEVRAYILDGLSLSLGGMRTGFSMVDNRSQAMTDINSRFEGDPINLDNYIRMDGLFLNLTAFLGNKLMPESRFNPYLRAGVMYFDWALESDGRGSDTIAYQDELIEGTDLGAGMGIGSEYRLGNKALLDLQLFWGYVKTGDEIKFDGLQSPINDSFFWTNTHYWNLSLGLVIGL